MYQSGKASWSKHIDFTVFELLLTQGCLILCFYLYQNSWFGYDFELYKVLAPTLLVIQLLTDLAIQPYSGILRRDIFKEFFSLLRYVITFFGATIVVLYLVHFIGQISRLVFGTTMLVFFLIAIITRTLWKKVLDKRAKATGGNRSVCVITVDEYRDQIANDFQSPAFNSMRLRCMAIMDNPDPEVFQSIDVRVIGAKENLLGYLSRDWVDEVLIYLPKSKKINPIVLDEIFNMGITVHTYLSREDGDRREFTERYGAYQVLTTTMNSVTPMQAFLKRCMDILGGLVGSLITIILAILVGPFIFFKDPGPIFFKQTRIGLNGKKFKMIKFRSMYKDAEARKKELMAKNEMGDDLMFKMEDDPRILGKVGKLIRKASIDEFPQFFNVLKGDMSMVGTRPPTEDEWHKYNLHHRARMSIKPGITGLWQTSGRSKITDFNEIVKLDTQYIQDWSIGLDIKLILKTVWVVLTRDGAE